MPEKSRHPPSSIRDRALDEQRHSPSSTREHRHDRRRRSPTPTQDRLSEEKRPSPSPSREPSRERRRRRRSPEPSEVSREERRRSPSPKVVPPESPKVSSKKSKKSGKKEKKDSKSSRRTEAVETVEDRTTRDERSRSTRRPESSRAQPPQSVSVEETETDDHPHKDDRQVVAHDRPAKPRPRFDPSREHAVAQRIMDKRRVVQPPREHGRDPGTDGPPDTEEEVKQRRRYPPPPPPASSMRQSQTSHRSLAFANPPPRRDSATESSRISDRQPLRIRSQETPPQRPMPRRVVATPTVGSSAPPRLQDTSGSAHRGEYYDQSQVRDDRTYGSQYPQERQDRGSSQRRAPSMGRRESLHAWAGHQYSGHQYQDWSQQQPSTQEYWHDPQHGHPQHYPQQSSATQHWHGQQQQQCNNSCLHYQILYIHQECNQVCNPLQVWDLMFKELGRVSPHKVHQCNMVRQQVDNSRQWALNHHKKGNNHLIVNSTHLQVDTLDRDISEHFIHFTEGGCSDT